jgi:uncharacterized MnhB-related membrane protein
VNAVHVLLLLLAAAGGSIVVLSREPDRQTLAASFYGLILAVLFLALQSPEVALSQIVIGTIGIPLILLLTLAKVRDEQASQAQQEQQDRNHPDQNDEERP